MLADGDVHGGDTAGDLECGLGLVDRFDRSGHRSVRVALPVVATLVRYPGPLEAWALATPDADPDATTTAAIETAIRFWLRRRRRAAAVAGLAICRLHRPPPKPPNPLLQVCPPVEVMRTVRAVTAPVESVEPTAVTQSPTASELAAVDWVSV